MDLSAINPSGFDAFMAADRLRDARKHAEVSDDRPRRPDAYDDHPPVAANIAKTNGPDNVQSLEAMVDRLPDDVRAEVIRVLRGEVEADYYSPENTANRIADFALSGFEHFDGGTAAQENTDAARQRFVDFVLPAIDRGFAEAMDILGPLHDSVVARVEETRELVGERMQAFAEQEPLDTVA